ncbi:MAG: adenylosuccinate synthase [Candidatus Eremiobacteraeota bacterium]|nr:adenylosuccinate synthase [Candidatus Eremiobacteraeota bacterium]
MKNSVIVGTQWGDEGKGKITHYLARNADIVVRYAGGNNAGHTVVTRGQTYRLHHIPSGIVFPGVLCIMGNGMVIDPWVLKKEIEDLSALGVDFTNLRISERAHVIMPYHRLLDSKQERTRGKSKIGTTGRGIGPAYTDKVSRTGIRIGDLLSPELLKEKIVYHTTRQASVLDGTEYTADFIFESLCEITDILAPMITDTSYLLYQKLKSGKKVLFEGAQGTLLDLDHGTYPFVTSSNSISGNFAVGCGISPLWAEEIIGVSKAYTTRVGSGPFPTELEDDTGRHLLDKGDEYGTTTGRPRRCGWLDLPILRYAVRVNGLTSFAITKLDVLSGLPNLKIAIAYELDGERIEHLPYSCEKLDRCIPIYKEFKGWNKDISGMKNRSDLPTEAIDYIQFIEKETEIPVSIISVGAGETQTIT